MRSISTVIGVAGLFFAASGSVFSQGGGVGYGGGAGVGGGMGVGGGIGVGGSFGTAGAGAIRAAIVSPNAGHNCSGYGSSMSGNGDSFVYTFRFGSCFAIPVVTNAPYSGHATSDNVRTLADGTHLSQATGVQPMIYRDAMGRTRTERSPIGPQQTSMLSNPNVPARPVQPVVPEIVVSEVNDPVAGYHYVLDPVSHMAHRVRVLTQKPIIPGTGLGSSYTMPNGATVTTESLGTQTMFGLSVTGTRNTTTYPPGTYQGNDRVVTSVSESWRSPEYALVLLSKNSGVNGDSTTSIKDLSLAAPDPALFQVPADYQIVDESNEFTFTIRETR